MKPVSVFEHATIRESLSGNEKDTLERLRGPHNERVFEVGRREVQATSFVGVVQLPQATLQVLPKMYRHEDAKEREATANLLFLLSYTRKLDVTEPEISRLTAQRAPFSEILFWVFAHRLWDAAHREVLRGYVTIEDRLDVLKGRWLVAAQAARPDGWRRDRFDVAYDEFTEDNLPNRLFKATVHRLSRWSQRTDTRRRLTQLRAKEVATDSHGWARIPATTTWPRKGAKKHKECHSEPARNLWLFSAMVARPSRLRLFPPFIILPSSF